MKRWRTASPGTDRGGGAVARATVAVLVLGIFVVTGCAGSEAPRGARADRGERAATDPVPAAAGAVFSDVTDQVGLDFVHRGGDRGDFMMPAIMRGGAAVFDYDNDGDLDIYFTDSGEVPGSGSPASSPPNRLYRQEADGRFTDTTAEAGIGDRGFGMGVTVFDFDNDGDLDLFASNFGADAFYRNNGDGTFANASREVGIGDEGWAASATACDIDRDGYLDLYVTRYLKFDERECADDIGRRDFCGPTEFPGVSDLLYRNDRGRVFVDVSAQSGIDTVRDAGLGVVCADFDDDGWMDFYVANDADPNNMWINQGDGSFVDQAVLQGAAYNKHGQSEASMGVSAGDADGDGDLDLFMTHLIDETNTFYENLGNAGFEDATAKSGLGIPSLVYTGFGTALFDWDNDGDLDAAVTNGATKRRPTAFGDPASGFWSDYVEPDLLFENDGSGRFADVSVTRGGAFSGRLDVGRALVPADIDRDGDLDLLVANTGGRARLFRNDVGGARSWIEIRAIDPALRREAVGARIVAVTAARRYLRAAIPWGSYQSSGHARVHLGLGDETRVERFEVRWPDGLLEAFPGQDAGRIVELRRGEGEPAR